MARERAKSIRGSIMCFYFAEAEKIEGVEGQVGDGWVDCRGGCELAMGRMGMTSAFKMAMSEGLKGRKCLRL